MLKYILILLIIPLILISEQIFADEIIPSIVIYTDKAEYYIDEDIFINGTITDVDWSRNTNISYDITSLADYTIIGSGSDNSLQNNGTFNFIIDGNERARWIEHSSDVLLTITIQDFSKDYAFYSSSKANMENEIIYEMVRVLEPMVSSHDTMVNEHSQNFISHNDRIDALLVIISALQTQIDGLRELVQGEAPAPDDTPIPVIGNFTAIPTGNGTVTLSWDIQNEPITLYNLIYRAEIGSWSTEFVSVNATTHTITDLSNIEYDFKFSAENEFGESRVERFSLIP